MELYTFIYNELEYKYHSGSGGPLVVDGSGDFAPAPIGRKEFQRTFSKDENMVTMPAALDPAPAYRYLNPTTLVEVHVQSYPDLRTLFTGVVSSCKYDAVKMTAELTIKGKYTLNDGIIPIRTYGTTCSWELFGSDCGVDQNAFATTFLSGEASISPDGYQMSHSSFGAHEDGYFSGGYLITAPDIQSQYIINHIGNTIFFLVPYNADFRGVSTSVFAGCDKTAATCKNRYNNYLKFSGYPYIPEKNAVVDGF